MPDGPHTDSDAVDSAYIQLPDQSQQPSVTYG
jgi:hypothetical protein